MNRALDNVNIAVDNVNRTVDNVNRAADNVYRESNQKFAKVCPVVAKGEEINDTETATQETHKVTEIVYTSKDCVKAIDQSSKEESQAIEDICHSVVENNIVTESENLEAEASCTVLENDGNHAIAEIQQALMEAEHADTQGEYTIEK